MNPNISLGFCDGLRAKTLEGCWDIFPSVSQQCEMNGQVKDALLASLATPAHPSISFLVATRPSAKLCVHASPVLS